MQATAPQVPYIPFTQASHEHVEPFTGTITATPGATAQVFEVLVPSYGYLRHVYCEVTSAGGALGTGVLLTGADFPYTVLDAITLLDTNGAPIFGPMDGYATYWANVAGGYAFQNNLKNVPWFTGTINPNFSFRIPVEIAHHSALGCLANQNAAAAYKVRLTVQPLLGGLVSAAGTATAPVLTIRLALEAWSLPNEVDALGRPQAQVPPNHGTIQYWSNTKPQVVVGNNFTQITRVGNLLRGLVFQARTAAPALSDTVFPNPPIISWDARQLINETQNYRSQVMFERLLGATRDAGVFAYMFNHDDDNHCGDDNPTLWLPTVQATRLELDGNSAAAGTIQILVNDVAPVALDQSQRYVETSGTGFHPNADTGAR